MKTSFGVEPCMFSFMDCSFILFQDGSDVYELTGLARGGQQMTKLKINYQKAVTLLVELASLQTSFITLDEVR